MAILRVRDENGNIHEITALRGEPGTPGVVTEEVKQEIVREAYKGDPMSIYCEGDIGDGSITFYGRYELLQEAYASGREMFAEYNGLFFQLSKYDDVAGCFEFVHVNMADGGIVVDTITINSDDTATYSSETFTGGGGGSNIETGFYTGTGKNYVDDSEYTCSLTFSFKPKIWGIIGMAEMTTPGKNPSKATYDWDIGLNFITPWISELYGGQDLTMQRLEGYMQTGKSTIKHVRNRFEYSGNTVTWYYCGDETSNIDNWQYNKSAQLYYYFAIG